MSVAGTFLTILAIMLAVAFLAKKIIFAVGFPCPFCKNLRLTPFNNVPQEVRRQIISYFRDTEHRRPEAQAVWVCRDCRTVFDDFSGGRRSGGTGQARCKVCATVLKRCLPEDESVRCTTCGTPHRWAVHEPSGFRFLMPPDDAKLRRRPPEY